MSGNNDQSKQIQLQQQQQKSRHLQQQLQSRVAQIENDIQKTYGVYLQSLNERRDAVLSEFHATVQFLLTQNYSKQIRAQQQQRKSNKAVSSSSTSSPNEVNSQDDETAASKDDQLFVDDVNGADGVLSSSSSSSSPNGSGSSAAINHENIQALINNHLMSIEFVANFNDIQNSVRKTFGYIRYAIKIFLFFNKIL